MLFKLNPYKIIDGLLAACRSQKFRSTRGNHSIAPRPMSLAYMAELLEIGYEETELALEKFSSDGLDATYFAPRDGLMICHYYPEAFILSSPRTDRVIILFVGTVSIGDWLQNIKSTNYEDVPVKETFFVPSGHAGFRHGIYNLIHNGFFKETLSKHISEHNVQSTRGVSVKITIIGHSQGAGLAQLAAPIVDGYKYTGQKIARTDDWPYEVEAIYAYAPPYAVSASDKSWNFMSETYGSITYQIIRDSDLVTSIYNAVSKGHTVPVRHFGKLIRITRDDEVVEEVTFWGSKIDAQHKNQPHHISGYRYALEKAANK